MLIWPRVFVVCCLYVCFVSSSPHCSQAADPEEIRKKIARLQSEVSDRLREIASLESQLKSTGTRMALDGYCPVTLVSDKRWVIGSSDHGVTFEGCVFFFADAQRRQEFQRSPQKFTPAMGGYDPVIWFEKGERVVGHRRHGVFYGHKIVLFASEESLARFSENPHNYLNLKHADASKTSSARQEHRDVKETPVDAAAEDVPIQSKTAWRLRCQRRRFRRRQIR